MGRQLELATKRLGVESTPKFFNLQRHEQLPNGFPHSFLTVPTNTTWARSRHLRPLGPKPLRDEAWPWGFPWLPSEARRQVDEANDELRWMFGVMVEALRRHPEVRLMLIHPEFFGAADRGTAASVWNMPEVREWARREGLVRAAAHQCHFGSTAYRNPVGILSSHSLNSKLFSRGWPIINPHTKKYVGPLPIRCRCGRGKHQTDALREARTFRAAGNSLIRDGMMNYLAALVVKDIYHCKISELLRKGAEYSGVRDQEAEQWDSTGDETWLEDSPPPLPTVQENVDSSGHWSEDLGWDHDLAIILGLSSTPPGRQLDTSPNFHSTPRRSSTPSSTKSSSTSEESGDDLDQVKKKDVWGRQESAPGLGVRASKKVAFGRC